MRCPYCGGGETQVKDSRSTEDDTAIRRRRVCLTCGGRFTTFERVQLRELSVIKRSGRRVPFDRDKLMRSVQVAMRKRPTPAEEIGNLVMAALKTVDDVAYVRFASVYKDFREARDFEAFIGELAQPDDIDPIPQDQ